MRILTTYKMINTQILIRQLKAEPNDLANRVQLAICSASLDRQRKRREYIDWNLRGQPRPRQR